MAIDLFGHIGPIPREGESEGSYLRRWSLFAAVFGALFLCLIIAAAYVAPQVAPWLEHNGVFMGFFFFALPLLVGMCVIGGLYTLALSFRPHAKRNVYSHRENATYGRTSKP